MRADGLYAQMWRQQQKRSSKEDESSEGGSSIMENVVELPAQRGNRPTKSSPMSGGGILQPLSEDTKGTSEIELNDGSLLNIREINILPQDQVIQEEMLQKTDGPDQIEEHDVRADSHGLPASKELRDIGNDPVDVISNDVAEDPGSALWKGTELQGPSLGTEKTEQFVLNSNPLLEGHTHKEKEEEVYVINEISRSRKPKEAYSLPLQS